MNYNKETLSNALETHKVDVEMIGYYESKLTADKKVLYAAEFDKKKKGIISLFLITLLLGFFQMNLFYLGLFDKKRFHIVRTFCLIGSLILPFIRFDSSIDIVFILLMYVSWTGILIFWLADLILIREYLKTYRKNRKAKLLYKYLYE